MKTNKYGYEKVLLPMIIVAGLAAAFTWHSIWHKTQSSDNQYTVEFFKAKQLQESGDVNSAKTVLQSLIQESPNRYESYLALGDILLKQGDVNGARSNFEAALLYCGNGPTNLVPHEVQSKERLLISNRIESIRGGRK